MSQQLQIWCEKLKREVTEGVPMARRIRLMTAGEGTVWETWEISPELEPAQWASDAEALIAMLVVELPKRRVQLVFAAEDAAGATVANLVRSVNGQNASAQDLGTQNGAKALAEAIASLAKTTDAVLETARKMMQFQADQLEKAHGFVADAHEVLMAIKKAELETEVQDGAASKIMMEQVSQAAPLLMQMLQHWATSPPKPQSLGGVAAAAAAATNGAKVS
jgi:hypothetical protein